MSGDSYTLYQYEKDGKVEIPVDKMCNQLGLDKRDEFNIDVKRRISVIYAITVTKVKE